MTYTSNLKRFWAAWRHESRNICKNISFAAVLVDALSNEMLKILSIE